MAHEATLVHETPAIGQLAKLLNRDLAPRRAVYWVYRIETPRKPFDRCYLLASCLFFLLLLAPRFFLLLASSRPSLLLASRFFSPLASSRFSLLLAPRFFSLHASSHPSLLLASRFFSIWQSRPGDGGVVGFPHEGFPYESDWPSLGGSRFCFSFRFSSVRDQEFSARRGG